MPEIEGQDNMVTYIQLTSICLGIKHGCMDMFFFVCFFLKPVLNYSCNVIIHIPEISHFFLTHVNVNQSNFCAYINPLSMAQIGWENHVIFNPMFDKTFKEYELEYVGVMIR